MAREAVLRDNKILTSRRYACASATAITKGAGLFLTPDGLVSSAYYINPASYAFVGFAHADKDASDGATSITADKGAVYDLCPGGPILMGAKVQLIGGNFVVPASEDATSATEGAGSYAIIIGHALEYADASSAISPINVEVYP